VPAVAVRAVSQEVKGSEFTKRGRNGWTRTGDKAIVGLSLSATHREQGLVGVSIAAYAIPAVVPRLLSDSVGDGHNAQGIAWFVDQRDFGGPEAYEVLDDEPASGAAQRLRRMVAQHIRPAAEHMLDGDHLLVHLRRRAFMRPSGWDEIVRFAAMTLDEGRPEEAVAALHRYAAAERDNWATYSSVPWKPPDLEELLIRKSMVSGQAAASRRSRDRSWGWLWLRRRVRG
jgi:hypothetical protein